MSVPMWCGWRRGKPATRSWRPSPHCCWPGRVPRRMSGPLQPCTVRRLAGDGWSAALASGRRTAGRADLSSNRPGDSRSGRPGACRVRRTTAGCYSAGASISTVRRGLAVRAGSSTWCSCEGVRPVSARDSASPRWLSLVRRGLAVERVPRVLFTESAFCQSIVPCLFELTVCLPGVRYRPHFACEFAHGHQDKSVHIRSPSRLGESGLWGQFMRFVSTEELELPRCRWGLSAEKPLFARIGVDGW